MYEVLLIYWRPREGYTIRWITEKSRDIQRDLMELIFFRALGFPERRVEPMYWIQNFFGLTYHCYYLGAHVDIPAIIMGYGDSNDVVRALVYDLAIKVRSLGIDGFDGKLPYNYSRIIRNLTLDVLPLFVFNNELVLDIYLLLLENPILRLSELAELIFHKKPKASIRDIEDALTLLNLISFIRVIWVKGIKWIELSKLLIPLRNNSSKLVVEGSNREISEKLSREIKLSIEVFIDPVLRKILVDVKSRGKINYDLTRRNELDFLINAGYLEKKGSVVSLKSNPIIKIFNIAGSKIEEFNI